MIAVDIDGVIANTDHFFIKEIEKLLGKRLFFKKTRNFCYSKEISSDKLLNCFRRVIVESKDYIQPYSKKNTITALRMIELIYGTVSFVTARCSNDVEKATHYWIKKHFEKLNYSINFIGEESKKEWMVNNCFDTIIEDRFKTVNDINFSNGNTFLVNRPWNLGRKEKHHVTRVSDILEAVNIHIQPFFY